MTLVPIEARGRPVRILMVDDSESDAALVRLALEDLEARAELVVVSDGEAALERIKASRTSPTADLVLLDLNLPRVHGFQVLQALKAEGPWRRVPVIVLSTSGGERDVEKSYDLHANSYLQKPPEFETLVAALGSVLTHWGRHALVPDPA